MAIVICILLISFIVWISCIPSGKSFFRKNINDYKKRVTAERKLKALGRSVIKDNDFQILMSEFENITTFVEVDQWDKEAEAGILRINDLFLQLENEVSHYRHSFSHSKVQQFLFKSTLQQIDSVYKVPLKNMANKLQEAVDFTPNSLKEKKELLKELKNQKKGLQLQKRELAANMKEIRRQARTQSVNAGQMIFGYDSKMAARERRGIRYRKEAQLHPHEDAVSAIERQLLQIDKDIFWVESIG